MKKLLTITALSLSIGISCVCAKAPRRTNAAEASDIYFTGVENNLTRRLEEKFNDPTGTAKSFIADWISDDTQTTGLSFFENYNDDSSSATYDEEYVTQAKNVMYYDVLLGSYLLTDFYSTIEQYRCFLDHLLGQGDTFKSYFNALKQFKDGEKTNEEFFLIANECYLASVNWLEECVSYYAENPDVPDVGDPDHWMEVTPTVSELISGFKTYLVTSNDYDKRDHHLAEIIKTDYPYVATIRENFNNNNLIATTSAEELLGYTCDLKDFWVADPDGYLAFVDLDAMKEKTLTAFLYAVDTIANALSESNIPSTIDFINHINNFGPTAYRMVEAFESFQRIETEPCCADETFETISNLLLFKEEVFVPEILNVYETKFDNLETAVNTLAETETHSPAQCKEVCNQIDSLSGGITMYFDYVMPLASLQYDLHTEQFNTLLVKIGAFGSKVSAIKAEIQGVYIDDIETDINNIEIEIAMAMQMLTVVESNFDVIDDFVEQIDSYIEYVNDSIQTTKISFTSPKLTSLENKLNTFIEEYNGFKLDLADAKALYERTNELLNPIKEDLETLGQAIGAVSGMLMIDTEDFNVIEGAIEDVKGEITRLTKKVADAKTELGETDDINALNNTLQAYSAVVNSLEVSATNAKTLSEKTHELLDPIKTAIEDVNLGISNVSGMLDSATDDFSAIEEEIADLKQDISDITGAINAAKTELGETDDIKSLTNKVAACSLLLQGVENSTTAAKALSEKTHELLNPIKTAIEDVNLGISNVSGMLDSATDDFGAIEEEIADLKQDISDITGAINAAKTELGETDDIKSLNNKVAACSLLLQGVENSTADAKALSIKKQKENAAIEEITDIYEYASNVYDFIEIGYKSEGVLINDLQETIEDAIKSLKTIPGLVSSFKEDNGYDLPGSAAVVSESAQLIEDFEELLTDALVYATKEEYASIKAEADSIETIYKLDDEKAETYINGCSVILDEINDLKETILARKDAAYAQEGLDEVNTLLTDLRIKVQAMSDDISSRHHEFAVTMIIEKGSVFEERVEAIVNNFKHNDFHFKGDLNECDALVEEMNAVIAEIDENIDSLNQDTRLTTLRNKLVSQVEAVNGAKESIKKAHSLNLALIIGGSVIAALGILTLLYFFGFKKRFLRKNA